LRLVGILLAAGAATRFGGDKLLHPLADGAPMAVRAATALREALSEAVAVIRPGRADLRRAFEQAGLRVVENAQAELGMGSSIAAGVAASADADGWLIHLADMPFVRASTILQVAHALERGAGIARPVFDSRPGHPVGFTAAFGSALLRIAADKGAAEVLRSHPDAVVSLVSDDPGSIHDIDRKGDLGRPTGKLYG
jgi:molybdenum cofactor cytidylyltransferase